MLPSLISGKSLKFLSKILIHRSNNIYIALFFKFTKMNLRQKLQFRKFIRELEAIRGRHTELVSVYVPAGYDIIKIIQHLQQEQGTASNIKDARTRNNVIDSLEKMVRHLRLYKRTPANGLAVFAGNNSPVDNKVTINVWSIEPPEPLNFRLYRCEQTFMLDPLKQILEHRNVYGLLVLDKREANIGFLNGSAVEEAVSMTSGVPGKTKAGGQCQVFGTIIQDATGDLIKIEDSHNPLVLKSADLDGFELKNSPITDKWFVKKPEIYKIKTKFPQLTLECSKDHALFVAAKGGIVEKRADKLNKGDLLVMPEKININGKIQKLNSKKYYNSFVINKKGRELILNQRKKNKLFQKELAKKLGVTQTAISFIEIGKRNINRELLRDLCDVMDINFRKFLATCTEPYKYSDIELPTKVDKELAQFLGYFLGDGSIEKDRITFFEQRKAVALAYKEKYDRYFSFKSSCKFRESKNYHQVRFNSRPLVRLIQKEFFELKKTFDSEVPRKILRSKEDVVASFLKGLFDAEGYVSNTHLGIASSNKTLVHQVQMLLLRFSIISSFSECDNRKNPYSKKPIYKLQITEKDSLELFKKHIDFTALDKSEKLGSLIKNKTSRGYVRQIIVPGSQVRKVIEDAGYNINMFPKVSNFFRDERFMSKSVFKSSILDCVKDKKLYSKLKRIHDHNLLPVQIDSIGIQKKQVDMVDISVKNQNFIANCLVVHNSAPRFARIREEMTKEFFKRIAEAAQKQFLEMKDLKGIIIGGPSPTKEDFFDSGYLNNELKRKVIGLKDLSYTGEFGLHELVDKSADLLKEEEVIEEKVAVTKLLEMLRKDPDKVAYGKKEVKNALAVGAVEKLLLSESLSEEEIEEFQDAADVHGTEAQIISVETREGAQLRDLGGVAAILRYALR